MEKKYLDQNGLNYFWLKIKDQFNNKYDTKKGKIIGYSNNADYKLTTATQGTTKIQQAINESVDGDTLYFEPGTYGGTGTITINKNISFIGLNNGTIPTISSDIVISYVNTVGTNTDIILKAYNMKFQKISCQYLFYVDEETYDYITYQGILKLYHCDIDRLNGTSVLIGDFNNCNITMPTLQCGGDEYNSGANFNHCQIRVSNLNGNAYGAMYFYDCDFRSNDLAISTNTLNASYSNFYVNNLSVETWSGGDMEYCLFACQYKSFSEYSGLNINNCSTVLIEESIDTWQGGSY